MNKKLENKIKKTTNQMYFTCPQCGEKYSTYKGAIDCKTLCIREERKTA
jgi:transcription initiation factor IIE alpha subunit